MQNKFLYKILCLGIFLLATFAQAQTPDEGVLEQDQDVLADEMVVEEPAADNLPDLSDRETVDFPARTSLDSMELKPLPGIYETDITGPEPLAASVSAKDMPSERLIGVLTPEVFKEMAEMERDNTFMKLQIQKEDNKNKLERLRATYRQDRLKEISQREEVVRERIRWWQEQEKIRQEMEAQRAALDAMKLNQTAVVAVAQETPETSAAPEQGIGVPGTDEDEEKEPQEDVAKIYTLMDITGTRGTLNARIKNEESGRISTIQIGDKLKDGSIVESISSTQVILNKDGEKIALIFNDV